MQIDRNAALNVVTIVVAVIACVASIRSCSISREALNTATSQFIAEKRPYLVVGPAKFSKSGTYLEIEKTRDGKAKLHFQLKIENIGNIAATDIRSEVLPAIGKQGPIPTKPERLPSPLALGPGQHVHRNYVYEFSGNEVDYAMKSVASLKRNPLEIWEAIRYRSEIDSTIVYETRIGYRVVADDTNLLFQETKRLPGSMVIPRP